ncbi:MAG: 50S ribosomal protein L19e [Nanoarchaeota archaeon]|nr:50S ribosomal protein L19e [Nanoarchaeota archaeon]
MTLRNKRRMISSSKGVGLKRIKFEPSALDEIKNAITKSDSRGLIKRGVIIIKKKKGSSRARARKKLVQKRKGRQKGKGSRKGKRTARLPRKRAWINKIRAQRNLLKELRSREIITKKVFSTVYKKTKGGFFRSRRHIKTYLGEHNLISENKTKPENKVGGEKTKRERPKEDKQ